MFLRWEGKFLSVVAETCAKCSSYSWLVLFCSVSVTLSSDTDMRLNIYACAHCFFVPFKKKLYLFEHTKFLFGALWSTFPQFGQWKVASSPCFFVCVFFLFLGGGILCGVTILSKSSQRGRREANKLFFGGGRKCEWAKFCCSHGKRNLCRTWIKLDLSKCHNENIQIETVCYVI